MKIKQIEPFNGIFIPNSISLNCDINIIVGRNGSGKSRFFEAIMASKFEIEGENVSEFLRGVFYYKVAE